MADRSTTPARSALAERIRAKLKHASPNDRAYERPMTWGEAEALLSLIPDESRPAAFQRRYTRRPPHAHVEYGWEICTEADFTANAGECRDFEYRPLYAGAVVEKRDV